MASAVDLYAAIGLDHSNVAKGLKICRKKVANEPLNRGLDASVERSR